MPLLTSSFTPPRYLTSAHLQTIIPTLFRTVRCSAVQTLTLTTQDSDVLLYRLYQQGSARLAIISHGLEGSFDSSYVCGMVQALLHAGFDVLTWNMRGCGDSPNRLVTWYHSGKSDDLKSIVSQALTLPYTEISLVGFSIGGNITLKYLGEEGSNLPPSLSQAVVVSVPMDLQGSADALARRSNSIYMQYLLRPLRRRIRAKSELFPDLFDSKGLSRITTFHEFDRRFTAPFHGFSSVAEYWSSSSSTNYLSTLSIPTLAISALDDPFLSPSCFPHSIAEHHPMLLLETPRHGGHVGFLDSLSLDTTWLERRAVEFLTCAPSNKRHAEQERGGLRAR
jgi:predicted alpha/beta-fold hydrolase